MGFGDLAATLIMFISVVVITAGVALVISAQLGDISSSARQSQELHANKIKTDISIDYVYYSAGTVTTYIKNTGQSSLDINKMGLYIDNVFFTVNGTNASATILPDTEIVNEGLLDNNEVVRIQATITLGSGVHSLKATTQYNTYATEIFSS